MGANEKHAATYHGGQYTPSELALITAWCDQRRNLLEYNNQPPEGIVERTEQAQRTLAKVRAEAKAEALNDMAHVLEADIPSTAHESGQIIAGRNIIRIIRARANQYKEN